MSGAFFGTILLIAVAAWWTLAAFRTKPHALPYRAAARIVAVAPFLLFSTIAVFAFVTAPADEYRVALEGLEFALADGESVTIGGAADGNDADDFTVRGLPPRFLTIQATGDRAVIDLPPELDHDVEHPEYAAVRVDHRRPFANSVALSELHDVVIAPSDREELPFDLSRRAFVAASAGGPGSAGGAGGTGGASSGASGGAVWPSLPLRMQPLPIGGSVVIGRNLTADVSTFPLRFWARPAGLRDDATGSDGAPLGSLLSWDGGYFRKTLYLTLVGDGTSLRHRDGVVRYQTRIAEVEPDRERHLALFRLDYLEPPADMEQSRSRAQERRSFRVRYDAGRLAIIFDTPDIVRLPATTMGQLREQTGKDTFLLATRDPRRAIPVAADQMFLSFPQLGPRLQNELYSTIRISNADACSLHVTTHTGVRCFELGDAFRIGDRTAAVVRVTRIGIPWGIVLTLLAASVLAWLWTEWHQDDPVGLMLISAAEVLLAIRLLIAFEGSLIDSSSASALWSSLVIYLMLPLTLRVARAWTRGTNTPRRRLSSYALIAAPCALLAGIALGRADIEPRTIAIVCATLLLAPLIAAVAGSWLTHLLTTRMDSTIAILLFASAVLLTRVMVWVLLGWKERASLGADLALSVVYVPAVLFVAAAVWQRYRTAPPGWRAFAPVLGLLFVIGLLAIAAPALVRDIGSVLVHLPALTLLFALPMLVKPNGIKCVLALPFVAMLLIHAACFIAPWTLGRDDVEEGNAAYQQALADKQQADRFLEERREITANQMRLMTLAMPLQLERAGTARAEGLVVQRRMLDRYGGRGLFGAGYLAPPLMIFGDTHLNDNLSAIHVLAPFGIFGAVGILTLLVVLALLPVIVAILGRVNTLDTPEEAIDQRTAAGILALWTFCLHGLYMFAANVGLVLFTGKNVYLLAAASKSDAIEGGVLLLMALLTLGQETKS